MDIQRMSDELINYGRVQQMQDLYIYLVKKEATLLFRRNSKMDVFQRMPLEVAEKIISRFKYLGGMDVGETRKAQLGAITYPIANTKQRLRLSTVGDYLGQESLVIRFLHDLDSQAMTYYFPEDIALIRDKTQSAVGLYLFSGPTGSGKTSLMYRLAREFAGQVITIEDPVEIEEPNFLQLQTNEKIDQSYDKLIKLSLRHRPDLLIIGEIRDKTTAKAAIRAALTGHTVFATVHARGVPETRSRLGDLLPEDNDLSHCLNGIIYQRLLLDHSQTMHGLLAYQFYTGDNEHVTWESRYKTIKKQVNEDENSDA